MNPPLTAHYREPLSTMERVLIPPHIALQGPCGHCGSGDPARWRRHRVDGGWVCKCFWYPERRPRYQIIIPEAEQPRLPEGGMMVVCDRKARPGNQCKIAPVEAWWAQ